MFENPLVRAPAPYIPMPLPEEPLYGYFYRFWRLAGQPNQRNLIRTLFGPLNSDLNHVHWDKSTAASALGKALRSTGFAFHSSGVLLHSLRALARPFWPNFPSEIPPNQISDHHSGFSGQLGMTDTLIKRKGSFCLDCVADDVQNLGVGHWRRSHQIAGVWFCPTHRTGLTDQCIACKKSIGVLSFPDTHCKYCGKEYAAGAEYQGTSSHRVAHSFGVAVEKVYRGEILGPLINRRVREHFRSFHPRKQRLPGADLCDYVASMAGDELLKELGLLYKPRERFPWPMIFLADRLVFGQASYQLLLYAAVTADHPNEDLWYDDWPDDADIVYKHWLSSAFDSLWPLLHDQQFGIN